MVDNVQGFIECPIEPKNDVLIGLVKAIKTRGFNFHPGEVLAEIDREAKRQFAELVAGSIKGVSLDNLIASRDEVFAWMNSEDVRFSAHKEMILAAEQAKLSEAEAEPVTFGKSMRSKSKR